MYGKELILDLKKCRRPFTRQTIDLFMAELCGLLDMDRADLHFWDYDDPQQKADAAPHLAGTSAVQFITTSNVTIHALDQLAAVYLNIFTCGTMDEQTAENFCRDFWQGEIVNSIVVERQ